MKNKGVGNSEHQSRNLRYNGPEVAAAKKKKMKQTDRTGRQEEEALEHVTCTPIQAGYRMRLASDRRRRWNG